MCHHQGQHVVKCQRSSQRLLMSQIQKRHLTGWQCAGGRHTGESHTKILRLQHLSCVGSSTVKSSAASLWGCLDEEYTFPVTVTANSMKDTEIATQSCNSVVISNRWFLLKKLLQFSYATNKWLYKYEARETITFHQVCQEKKTKKQNVHLDMDSTASDSSV